MLRTRHLAALAAGLAGPAVGIARYWLAAQEPTRARVAAIQAAAEAAECLAPADELASLELALSVRGAPGQATGSRGREDVSAAGIAKLQVRAGLRTKGPNVV